MADKTFADFTETTTPAGTEFLVGYAAATPGGERKVNIKTAAAPAIADHVAASDPHGDRAAAATDATTKANAAQAYAVQRANHSGTQAATTITEDSTHRFATDAEKSAWNAKQDALSNASTLAKITESGGAPLWNGGAWPGGGGDQTNITGNAGTATALQTARTINGVSFDGTANITVTAVDQTARNAAAAAETNAETYSETRRQWAYHGVYTQPTLTDNGNGTLTVGANGVIQAHTDASGTSAIIRYSLAGAGPLSFTDNTVNYLIADSSGYSVTTSAAFFNDLRYCAVAVVYRTGTSLHILPYGSFADSLAEKLLIKGLQTEKFKKVSGLALSESATRIVNVSSGVVYFGVNIVSIPASNSSTDLMQLWYHSAGVWTSTNVTQYNNTQYDDGTNLQTLSNNQYGVVWVYRGVESDNHAYLILGNGSYTLAQAQASQPDGLPGVISNQGILVGRIIVQKNASTATQIDQVATTTFTTSPAVAHNDLIGIQGGAAGDYLHATSAQQASWTAKQDARSNATTLAKITESAGAPLWNGSAWPGVTAAKAIALAIAL